MRRGRLSTLLLSICAATVPAFAQTVAPEPPVGPGDRVRITASPEVSPQEMVGLIDPTRTVEAGASRQDVPTVRAIGTPVLTVPRPGSRLVGVLAAVDERALRLRLDDGTVEVTVPRAAAARVERSAGRRSRLRYTGFGALAGLGGGAAVGLVSSTNCQPNALFCSPGFNALVAGILGAGVGALVGLVIPPATRWVKVGDRALTAVPQGASTSAPTPVRR